MITPYQRFAEALVSLNLLRNGYTVRPSSKLQHLHATDRDGKSLDVHVRAGKRPSRRPVAGTYRAEVLDDGRTILLSRALGRKIVLRDPRVDIRIQ
jgi:hypothetical protein